MKLYHTLCFYWHSMLRRLHHRSDKWQTATFERHHKAMKYHKQRVSK